MERTDKTSIIFKEISNMEIKNKKLHDIMKHSNNVTKKLVEINNLDNPKEIAKINQITDLFISVKSNEKLLQLLTVAVDMVVDYINKENKINYGN